eukprot:TRINITY_DN1032_c2_g1_i1.p1 TRINITY_DN1032_c2_g1~~TRINITY_DN1032_c2_g1_i1.p1  ORF type:complete len:333 (-),score=108.15 TRINITY_DN1032_c2_g1_i1:45-1043(-)
MGDAKEWVRQAMAVEEARKQREEEASRESEKREAAAKAAVELQRRIQAEVESTIQAKLQESAKKEERMAGERREHIRRQLQRREKEDERVAKVLNEAKLQATVLQTQAAEEAAHDLEAQIVALTETMQRLQGVGSAGGGVESWSIEEVVAWVKNQSFHEYAECFRENDITGDLLVLLEQSDLEEMGVGEQCVRERIIEAIEELLLVSEAVPASSAAAAAAPACSSPAGVTAAAPSATVASAPEEADEKQEESRVHGEADVGAADAPATSKADNGDQAEADVVRGKVEAWNQIAADLAPRRNWARGQRGTAPGTKDEGRVASLEDWKRQQGII